MDMDGNRIRSLRIKNGLSQRELANRLEISATTLSRYENNINVYGWESLRKIALELNTSMDYLLCLTDIKAPFKNISNYQRLDWDLVEKFSRLDRRRQIALLELTQPMIDSDNLTYLPDEDEEQAGVHIRYKNR